MSRAAFAQQVRDDAVRADQVEAAAEIARASMPPARGGIGALITWRAVRCELPDADLVVLVSLAGDVDDETWLGFTDGQNWYDACTGAEFVGHVTHWADMPARVQP